MQQLWRQMGHARRKESVEDVETWRARALTPMLRSTDWLSVGRLTPRLFPTAVSPAKGPAPTSSLGRGTGLECPILDLQRRQRSFSTAGWWLTGGCFRLGLFAAAEEVRRAANGGLELWSYPCCDVSRELHVVCAVNRSHGDVQCVLWRWSWDVQVRA